MFIIDVVYADVPLSVCGRRVDERRLRPTRPLTVRINNQILQAACPAVVKPIVEDKKIKYSRRQQQQKKSAWACYVFNGIAEVHLAFKHLPRIGRVKNI